MRAFETEKTEIAEVDRSVYDIKDKVNAAFEVNSGLTAEIVEKISEEKHDPEWMREFRLKALDTYNRMSLPTWGPSLEGLDMSNIVTYVRPNTEMRGKWSKVPRDLQSFSRPDVGPLHRGPGHGQHRHLRQAQHRPKARLGVGARRHQEHL